MTLWSLYPALNKLILLLSCSELAQTEGKQVSPVFPHHKYQMYLVQKNEGKIVLSNHNPSEFDFPLFDFRTRRMAAKVSLFHWRSDGPQVNPTDTPNAFFGGFPPPPPPTTYKWNSSTGMWCHSQIQIPSLGAEWNWPWVSARRWAWTAKTALVPLPSLNPPPQTSVSGNTSPVNIGSHYPRTVVDQMNNHLVLFWGGFPLWRWNNSVSLNPVHVCGTRIWPKFTLKSSSIESSVMRWVFFFPPSFGVFPFCNKTFYWEELSPVDGSAVGKTPKEALKWVWFSNSSCTHFAGSQRGEGSLWWEECRAASIIIPDLGISMDMMKWNHCFWMQNKKSECFQVWQVF